jgi:hypothetical protein
VEIDFSVSGLSPTCKRFAQDDSLVRVIKGPVGSGKSTVCNRELGRRALRQRQGKDGLRHSRWVVIRNAYRQLKDTTRVTFEKWVPRQLGRWYEQDFKFVMRFADVEAEILFRALDRPEDIDKLLSLEITGAYVNEIREVPKTVVDMLENRVGRYPSQDDGGPSWYGIWGDTNPWHTGHWGAKLFAKDLPGYRLFTQPGGREPNAENIDHLPGGRGYYDRLVVGKDKAYVDVYVDGKDADGAVGSIFGSWVATLQQNGGICAFDHLNTNVITVWDLGHSDSTGIWFFRVRWEQTEDGKLEPLYDIIDHYENANQGLSHYFSVVDGKKYAYAQHILPHDAKAKTLATQVSVYEQCAEHWGAGAVSIAPDLSLADGISAGRWLLEQRTRIHERCDVPGRLEHSGLEALREYRYEWDDIEHCYSTKPLHNWASHTADAFRYMALVAKHSELMLRPAPGAKRVEVGPVEGNVTIERLLEMNEGHEGRRGRV